MVKLVVSSFYSDRSRWESCREKLDEKFGDEDYQSPETPFEHTDYYRKEMGYPLFRRFLSYERPVHPGDLVEIKLFTNQLEMDSAENGMRRVNLDPGCLGLGQFVLATGKPVAHRIYLGEGIYAYLALIYENGSFQALPWTYPDYASEDTIKMLNGLREKIKAGLRAEKRG